MASLVTTTVNGNLNFETAGQYLTFYGSGETEHSISSRNSSGNAADDLRINTFGALFINLDSNNNNTSGADFSIGRHGQTGAITDWLLDLSGESGKLTLSKYGSGTHTGTLAKSLGVDSSGNVIEFTAGGGTVDGSGTANYVAKWSGSGTIANSVLRDDGNRLAVGAAPSSAAGILHLKDVSSNQAKMTLESANAYNSWINFSAASDEMSIGYDKSTVGGFVFANADALNSNIRMVILSAGSVGIGTVSPSLKFQVHSGDILITSGKQLISTNSYTQAPPAMLTTQGPSTGATSLGTGTWGIMLGPQHTRATTANTYYPGIAFNHLLNNGGVATYNNHPQAWIGTRLHDTPGSERAFLVFSTKGGTGVTASDVPLERMCIDPVNGSVGIGTTDPAAELEIGRPQTTSAFTDSFIKLRPSSTTNSTGLTSITFGTSTVDNYGYSISGWRAGTDGAPYLAIKYHNNSAAGVDAMVMDNLGNVGIGTNAPAVELHINDASGLSAIRLTGGAASADGFQIMQGVTGVTNAGFSIYDVDAAATRFVIDSSGNATIGGTSSQAKLNIRSSVSGNYLYMDDGASVLWSISANGSTSGVIQTQGTGFSSWKPMDLRANYFQFKPNNIEIMRLVSTGVGIGTTIPQGKLDINTEAAEATHVYINGEANQDKLLYFRHYANSEGAGANAYVGYIGSKGTDNLLSLGHLNTSGSDVPVMHLTESGLVGIGTKTPSTEGLEIAKASADTTFNVNDQADSMLVLRNSDNGSMNTGRFCAVQMKINSSGSAAEGTIRTQFAGNGNADLIFSTTKAGTGVDRMVIDEDGSVGIGTGAPLNLLNVYGGTDISPTSGGAGQFGVQGNGYKTFLAMDSQAAYFGHNSSARELVLMTNETARLSITGGGAATFSSSVAASSFSGNGASLTSLNASNLSSGTVPAARLGSLNASNLSSGTVPGARLGNVFAGSSAADVISASNGTIGAVDAAADKLVFWDDSASKLKYLSFSDLTALP